MFSPASILRIVRKLTPQRSRQGGFIMLVVLLMISGLLFVSVVAGRRSLGVTGRSLRDYHDERVFQVADGGADVAQSWLKDQLEINPNPTQSMLNGFTAPTLTGFRYPVLTITKLPLRQNVLIRQGALEDL